MPALTSTAPADFGEAPRPSGVALLPGLLLLAFWPVAQWYVERMRDRSDEPWGLLALAAALGFLWRDRAAIRLTAARLRGAAALLIFQIAAWSFLPPLARGILCVFTVATLALPPRGAGMLGLLLLSLPVLASVQFYFGYPLRVLTATASAVLLKMAGLPVEAAGTVLHWRGETIIVDAPCSGVNMLWGGLFLAAALSALARQSARRALATAVIALAAVIAGNIVRATVLFFKESGLLALPEWTHAGIGLLFFILPAQLIARFAQSGRSVFRLPKQHPAPARFSAFAVLCLLAACRPFAPVSAVFPARPAPLAWPAQFAGEPLTEIPLGPRDHAFARNFPGAIKTFRAGDTPLIVRQVERATRKLHPSRDCFRALGYEVTTPKLVSRDGDKWSQFTARQAGRSWTVRERITTGSGEQWTDTSAWFWSAVFGRSVGPWVAWTVIEPLSAKTPTRHPLPGRL